MMGIQRACKVYQQQAGRLPRRVAVFLWSAWRQQFEMPHATIMADQQAARFSGHTHVE
jgi:hypothetical protein